MNWHSFGEFIAMGGYAPYVWGSVAVTALCLVGEVLVLRARRRAIRALVIALGGRA
jgi:heme exporter protein D